MGAVSLLLGQYPVAAPAPGRHAVGICANSFQPLIQRGNPVPRPRVVGWLVGEVAAGIDAEGGGVSEDAVGDGGEAGALIIA